MGNDIYRKWVYYVDGTPPRVLCRVVRARLNLQPAVVASQMPQPLGKSPHAQERPPVRRVSGSLEELEVVHVHAFTRFDYFRALGVKEAPLITGNGKRSLSSSSSSFLFFRLRERFILHGQSRHRVQ